MSIKYLSFFLVLLSVYTLTDPSSFSNYDQIKQTKVQLNFNVDFKDKTIHVTEKLHLEGQMYGEVIVLDTKDLIIESIIDSDTGEPLKYEIDHLHKLAALGTPLKIYKSYIYKQKVTILIKCRSGPSAEGVQFLTNNQTFGRDNPFMFTQGESILVRTIFPIQDTPAVKLTVDASVTVPDPLVGVYAGIYTSEIKEGNTITYFYKQEVVIPSYLIALAAGKLEKKPIYESQNITILAYAEKEILNQTVEEFSETKEFLEQAEKYAGPYVWKQYNLLVLPPSFPFGGMENPCLTFVTPSIIAGDKSLAAVILHEISHSWSGNLVTMDTWSDFWMNEGFTMFLQRKITEIKYGTDRALISAQSGLKILKEEIQSVGESHEFTKLHCDVIGRNPEDAFNQVPYEKGYNFVYYIEQLVNTHCQENKFNDIIKKYFSEYAYKSIDYRQLVSFLKTIFFSIIFYSS